MMGVDLKRYDLFGWDYETVTTLTEAEVAWYRTWAERTGGPLLGLACGSGRLLCRLATAGFEVVGLDLSPSMLRLARERVALLPAAERRRVRLIRADMSDFDLARRFGLIFIADNSFRGLPTRRGLLACLRCIRRHLLPDGRLLIAERRFDSSRYPGGSRSFGWSDPLPHPETGELISRRGQIHLSKNHKRARGTFLYRITHADGSETLEDCPWSAPMLTKDEYLTLFTRAGFDVQTFVDYKEEAGDTDGPILCFVCRPVQSHRHG